MEIFGIPVFLIVIFVIWAWSNYSDEQQKEKGQIARKWDGITTEMSREDVLGRLGKPIRLVEVGVQEAWGYGPRSSDGEIMFVEGRVVGYRKPSCTLHVSGGQVSETGTADNSDGLSPDTDTMNVNVEFYAPNGLRDLGKIIISHFAAQSYRLLQQQSDELSFTRGSKWSCLYRTDIQSYYTQVTVRIGNETEQGTCINVDFEVYTWKAVTDARDAAVLEAEGKELESRMKAAR